MTIFENLKNRKFSKIRNFDEHFQIWQIFQNFRLQNFVLSDFSYGNLPTSLLNRPIKCKETKYRAVQGRLESKINLHPALAKSKIPDLGQYKFKWQSQVNPMKFGDFLESIHKVHFGFCEWRMQIYFRLQTRLHTSIFRFPALRLSVLADIFWWEKL